MRFSINLATRPYQDAGRFYGRWLLALFAVTIVSVGLVYLAAHGWRASYEANRTLRQERQELAKLEAWEKADKEILGKPENHDVQERSQFLNDLIRRKAFSWTQVFSELEHIMPPRLHVVSIKPELSNDNQLAIRMQVAGDSRERAVELVRRMEQSRSFRAPAVDSETTQTQPPDTVRFEISALYIPQPPPPQPASPPQPGGK